MGWRVILKKQFIPIEAFCIVIVPWIIGFVKEGLTLLDFGQAIRSCKPPLEFPRLDETM